MKLKLTKVFFDDKRLKDIYVGATRFEVFKYRAMRLFKRVTITLFLVSFGVGSIYGGYKLGEKSNVQVVMAQTEVDVTDVRFSRKIDELKMKLVDELMACESGGYKDEDGLITFDPHRLDKTLKNAPSIGKLQFKVDTIIYYQKTLYNVNLSRTEAVKLALDTDKAKILARDILFKSRNKANDWLNCANKLDLNKKIDIIKQLEK